VGVCLFDVKQITANMLESVMKERSEINNHTPLQDALKGKKMVSNNFLLVLDSVWSVKNCSDWRKLLTPRRSKSKSGQGQQWYNFQLRIKSFIFFELAEVLEKVFNSLKSDKLVNSSCYL